MQRNRSRCKRKIIGLWYFQYTLSLRLVCKSRVISCTLPPCAGHKMRYQCIRPSTWPLPKNRLPDSGHPLKIYRTLVRRESHLRLQNAQKFCSGERSHSLGKLHPISQDDATITPGKRSTLRICPVTSAHISRALGSFVLRLGLLLGVATFGQGFVCGAKHGIQFTLLVDGRAGTIHNVKAAVP